MHNLNELPTSIKSKKTNLKKVVSTRWLSLHASVSGVYDEYIGLLEALNLQAKDKGSRGAVAKGLAKKMKSLDFLEMLYRLCKVMLRSLFTLSKCFQSGAIKVSRIILKVLKTKLNFGNFLTIVKPLIYWKMSYRWDWEVEICK